VPTSRRHCHLLLRHMVATRADPAHKREIIASVILGVGAVR
jgi:hypothetical protein